MTAEKLFKTLGNKIRLRLLCLLRERDWRVGDLQAITGLPMAVVSKDLMRMRAQNLVTAKRRGVSITYSLSQTPETEALRNVLQAVQALFPQEVFADAEAVKNYIPSALPQTAAEEKQFSGNTVRNEKRHAKTSVPATNESSAQDSFGSLPTNLL